MAMTILWLVIGLVVMVAGAEGLVRGASRLAARAGIPALVIGLTIVAFGTSSPELAVSVTSALRGDADIALGNVVGSNIFNVLFILGISAAIVPLVVAQQLVRLDVPIMIGISVLLLLLALDGHIGRWEGALLTLGIISYLGLQVLLARRERSKAVEAEYEQEYHAPADQNKALGVLLDVAFIAGGLVMLVFGARWLVQSSVSIAQSLGVSELIIGLTIVAAGTSLPEVATSIVASMRGERDIAVGNVIGSNIFNILAVIGLTTLFAPDGMNVPSEAIQFDIPVMIAVAVACLPIFFAGNIISRWTGFLFLGYYAAYTTYLVLFATQSPTLEAFNTAMIWFVLPITVVTLAVGLWREWRNSLRPAETTP